MWIVLSLTGTGLLLAVTNELCQNVAVVPLLWIVPLTGYLLTFIFCFSGLYRRSLWMWVLLADFYEINPAAVDFARRYFTFLSGSPATIEVTLGDARLSLERELRDTARHHTYDVLAIDAFSGDAIPVHLLTREAFALYRDALREDGVLAVHVSNHYLDLPPIVRGLAAEQGRQVALIETADDESRALDSSTWMLVTNNAALLENAEPFIARPEAGERSLVWTDAFSSLLQVLKK